MGSLGKTRTMPSQLSYSLRILFKYWWYASFSLLGLGIAVSSIWFIADYVRNAHQYDAFHKEYENIYRLTMDITAGGHTDQMATTGKPPGPLLQKDYPGITAFARMTFFNPVVDVEGDRFREDDFYSANPQALEVFSFNFITEDAENRFSAPRSILLCRSLAEKYYRSVEVVGKPININEEKYVIGGVFEDWPENTHLHVNALISSVDTSNYEPQDWFDMDQYTYVLLDPSNDQDDLEEKLAHLKTHYLAPILEDSGIEVTFRSQALKGLYFTPALVDDVAKGNWLYIHALTLAGILVLLIAGLNYLNLSLMRAIQRSKEIAIKKILGISSRKLLWQSSMDSGLMTLLVISIATALIASLDHSYFEFTGFSSLDTLGSWRLILPVLAVIFVLGIIGTSYSGVYLSFSKKLVNKESRSVDLLKKGLLGFQFAIASVILMVTLTMKQQVDFMKEKDLGFSKEQIQIIELPEEEELKRKGLEFRELTSRFVSTSNASLVGAGALPGEDNGKEIFQVVIEGVLTEKIYNIYWIDENYIPLLDIELAKGRNFQPERSEDQHNKVMINETLARSLNWEDPLGKKIEYGGQTWEVIGVVKNFHNKSLHNLIEPIVFLFDRDYASNLLVKTNTSDISKLKSAWADFFPGIPFSLTYFDQFIDSMYVKEDQLVKLLTFFSIICLCLCCIGLYAVFSLHVIHRTKEMSIRKILGANVLNLFTSLTGKYATITLLAIGVAIPTASLLAKNWLAGFSYRIDLEFTGLLLSAAIILLVSLITIAHHLIQVLWINPAETLKNE